jgi:metal-responsive CopG/Arc/MetJ family transcriptional regulator
MIRNSTVVSISLQPEVMAVLEQLSRGSSKTRSEVIKDLIISCAQDKSWEQIFAWGRKTKERFNIRSEEDILKIINDYDTGGFGHKRLFIGHNFWR